MTNDQQFLLLLAQCRSMVLLFGDRLGVDNPWAGIKFEEYDLESLISVRKLMHELLYAPPVNRS